MEALYCEIQLITRRDHIESVYTLWITLINVILDLVYCRLLVLLINFLWVLDQTSCGRVAASTNLHNHFFGQPSKVLNHFKAALSFDIQKNITKNNDDACFIKSTITPRLVNYLPVV